MIDDLQTKIARGRWDIAYFARELLGITLHSGQIRFAKAVLTRDKTRWRPAYLTILLSAGNKAGKTLILAIVILHSVFYKVGTRPPKDDPKDIDRWQRAEYHWFHLAIQQEVAELVFAIIGKILSGLHEAQGPDGCPLTNELPNAVDWTKKYGGEYRWIVLHAMLGGGEIHFRTTSERALGSLGRDMHGISFDEAAFEPHLEFVVGEVLHLRRLTTGGQLLLISTPTQGLTAFADMWETGNPESPDRRATRMSQRMSTRDNIGFGLEQSVFDQLVADMPPELIPQNIDGFFVEGKSAYFSAASVDRAFVDEMPEMVPATDKHVYVQGVDAGLRDSSWSVVFDCTRVPATGVKVMRTRGKQTTTQIVALAADSHNAYNVARARHRSWCSTAIDATGFGGKMFAEALDGISPLRLVEFGGSKQKKLKLLGDLKTMLDQGKLLMPRSGEWLVVRRQLLGYKLADRAIDQDAVMALACAVAEIRRSPAEAEESVPFDVFTPGSEVPAGTPSWLRDDLNTRTAY